MIYLDYSANTPVDARVLEQFCAVERRCIGNANSHHQAGSAAKAEIDAATIKIASLLGVQPAEIIYTSGASEANNFALKGLARLSRHAGRHIISTPLEHSSVSGTLTALQEQGYEIDLLDVKQDGTVDLEHLKDLLRPDTICVAVTLVDSELGVVQPVQEIAAILKAYPHCHLHVDATQAVGKIPVSFEGVDTMSLTAHKFYGLNGIGLLLNEKISWREYGRVGAILVCLFVTVCCIEWLSHVLGRIIRGERSIPRGAKCAIWAAVLVCVVVCTAGIEAPDLAHTSKSVLAAMGTGLLHPDWSFFFGTGKDGLGWLLLETVGIALAGTGFGALLALPLAFLSTPKLLPRPVALLFRVLIVAIRSVPFLIYGLIFIRVSGPGAFTGVLTLAVCSIGLLSKRFTEAIESLDFRAYDALRAMGVSLLPRIRYAVLPQLGPAFSSAVLYRFDVNIREASVLGLVGAGGIGAPLIFAMNQYAWNDVSAIFLGFVLLVWLIDVGSARLRTRRTAAAAPGK